MFRWQWNCLGMNGDYGVLATIAMASMFASVHSMSARATEFEV
jgi:hypothetical protein